MFEHELVCLTRICSILRIPSFDKISWEDKELEKPKIILAALFWSEDKRVKWEG